MNFMQNSLDNKHLDDIRSFKKSVVEIPALSHFPELNQGFTTRFGGVSTGDYATFNLSFHRPDPKSNVLENYRLLSRTLGISLDDMVLSYQVHGKKVLPVSKKHAGMGVTRERSFKNVDGLATQDKGIMLVTHYADCVPIFFYDPVKKAIALSHSGWKGTLSDIAGETVRLLKDIYESDPKELFIAFGPHIKDCCFEVDVDVARQFQNMFPWASEYSSSKADGKWNIDLEGIIIQSLLKHGVNIHHISGCRVCTKCNKDLFFSHRGSMGKTGTGAAFMMIRG